jgi:hypothetical protein
MDHYTSGDVVYTKDFMGMINGLNQIGVIQGLEVTESSPNSMSVDVSSGRALFEDVYIESGDETLELNDSDVSNDRKDLIYLLNDGTLGIATGDAASTPTPISTDMSVNPDLYLTFDAGQGTTAYDFSGNAYNGTLYNSPSWTNGKYNRGLEFEYDTDMKVEIDTTYPHLDDSDFTICGWFKPTPYDAHQFLVFKQWIYIHIPYGLSYILCVVYDGSFHPCILYTSIANKWYFVAMVFEKESSLGNNDGTLTSYLYDENGLLDTDTDTSIGQLSSTNSYKFRIGREGWWGSNNSYYDGIADDILVYKYALTSDEIKTLYNGFHKDHIILGQTTVSAGASTILNSDIRDERHMIYGNKYQDIFEGGNPDDGICAINDDEASLDSEDWSREYNPMKRWGGY